MGVGAYRWVAMWASAAAMIWLLWRFTLPVALLSIAVLVVLRLSVFPHGPDLD